MTDILSILGPITIGSTIALPVAIWSSFKALEDAASEAAKTELSAWLAAGIDIQNISTSFENVLFRTFESIFGFNIFNRKFLVSTAWFSALAFFVFMPTMTYFVATADKDIANNLSKIYLTNVSFDEAVLFFLMFVKVFCACFFGALLCDWLSLAKSALLILSARNNGRYLYHFFVDVCISFLMAVGWIFFG